MVAQATSHSIILILSIHNHFSEVIHGLCAKQPRDLVLILSKLFAEEEHCFLISFTKDSFRAASRYHALYEFTLASHRSSTNS